MELENLRRRQIIKGSASALALTSFPALRAFGQTTLAVRREWQALSSAQRTAYASAIGVMKANTNAADPASMQYWANIHKNNCPHGISYFAAWHRGFLYYFERQLRTVAGDSTLVVPYWDYYKYVTIPVEFNDPGSPLYMNRVNTNVYSALSMTPFGSTLVNFPRGMTNAFEPSVEYKPHNSFHNILGNTMATMLSPLDPIFWSHHSQIDRLWIAWLNKGGGRQMPAASDAYWTGSFTYGASLGMPRIQTIDTRTYLNYQYDNEAAPTALPSSTSAATTAAASTTAAGGEASADIAANGGVPPRPPLGKFKLSPPTDFGTGRHSVGGALNVGLDDNSVSVQIQLSEAERRVLMAALAGQASQYVSVQVVLDNLHVTGAGAKGGYFYNVYVDLPVGGGGAGSEDKYLLGSIGPFEIEGVHQHHGAEQLAYPATLLMKQIHPANAGDVTISFVRVNGDNAPRGRVIDIGEARVELAA
jgi:tyrosinase